MKVQLPIFGSTASLAGRSTRENANVYCNPAYIYENFTLLRGVARGSLGAVMRAPIFVSRF